MPIQRSKRMYLGIETSSKNCSVALWNDQGLIGFKEQVEDAFVHAELLHTMIEQLISETHVGFKDIEGVVVGRGPGSYTGLRIGVSCAKGIAFSLGVPLYSISTLVLMGIDTGIMESSHPVLLVMDARRNEVFGSWLKGGILQDPMAIVFEEKTRLSWDETIIVAGENASKLAPFLRSNDQAINTLPSARVMSDKQAKQWIKIEDLAYFEPQYVKAFVPTVSKKI